MRDFITEIRKIPTSRVLLTLSEISIDMFRKMECRKDIDVEVVKNGLVRTGKVALLGWDIQNIAFLSVKHSNDYRDSNSSTSVSEIINLYRKYDNDHSAAEQLRESDIDGVFRIIMGMSSEQFPFQQLGIIFEKFNRDYYILMAADHFEHHSKLDMNGIVEDTFDYSADDYVAVLMMVFWLCNQSPIPLRAMERVSLEKESDLISVENLTKFIDYYSCTYKELRESKLGKQLLYSKPFIKTQRTGSYITSNMFLVAYTIGNGLYWLVRDHYCNLKSQHFINTFGLLFEDYIKDLAQRYCVQTEWKQLSQGKKKGADFLINFGNLIFLIESKSGLLPLGVKQQVPNLEQADLFFMRTIQEAYEQLQSSYDQISRDFNHTIIKVILLYDDFSNTGIIEKSITGIFDNDPNCFIMTIRDLEIFLYLHKYDPIKRMAICERIIDQLKLGKNRESIGGIYESLDITGNPHLSGEMDYFQNLLKHFEKKLKSI